MQRDGQVFACYSILHCSSILIGDKHVWVKLLPCIPSLALCSLNTRALNSHAADLTGLRISSPAGHRGPAADRVLPGCHSQLQGGPVVRSLLAQGCAQEPLPLQIVFGQPFQTSAFMAHSEMWLPIHDLGMRFLKCGMKRQPVWE